MREGERDFLAAEALVTAAMLRDPGLGEATRVDRERAEWCLAMLSDHAWNGTHRENKNHNADLRRKWSQELKTLAAKIRIQAWKAMGIGPSADGLTLFNPLSFPRRGLVRMDSPVEVKRAGTQDVDEDGRNVRYFVSATVPGFGAFASAGEQGAPADGGQLRASAEELDGPYYRLRVDAKRGGIASLVHKSTGRELIHAGNRSIGQTIYHDGQEHVMMDVSSRVVAAGPVLARIGIEGAVAGIQVTQFVTIYRDLDHVDLDVRIRKPLDSKPQRLCHVFPVVPEGGILRIETTGAVIRPRPQPDGDLLPGADTRRFAVQGFVDASCPEGPGVTIAPLDAFVLRTDLDSLTFEALGNDQNHAEVIQDQHGLTDFRFRYALRAHANAYSGPEVIRWSRAVSIPLLAAPGLPRSPDSGTPEVCIDPARAVATCLKPADFSHPDGIVVRIWETAGRGDPLALGVQGFTQARRTDLLERDIRDLPIQDGQVRLDVRGYGLTSVRLSR
jgi:hypothetical protein